ncbi:hypothetical protein [Magnetospirillum sp. UT-4]|uniref:hypothetical protein n=1 Tax=Magnetospirillum sp. UT-4 TaxID=2681467 RepID=UPI0013858B08|nr:hypothetical protein [Magnetospirillum sp. UT-4]CAA7619631.1 hypothetical protein MTBUT4_310026 [Magnetospirillum sp. UT-4]
MLVVVRNLKVLQENSAAIGDLVRRLEPVNGPLRGVWCDPASASLPEARVAVPCAPGVYRSLRFEQSFERVGVWAVWRFEPYFGADAVPWHPSHRDLAGALLSRDGERDGHLYVPVFDGGARRRAVAAEMDRLTAAYPQRIGAPLYRNGLTGRLSWTLAAGAA